MEPASGAGSFGAGLDLGASLRSLGLASLRSLGLASLEALGSPAFEALKLPAFAALGSPAFAALGSPAFAAFWLASLRSLWLAWLGLRLGLDGLGLRLGLDGLFGMLGLGNLGLGSPPASLRAGGVLLIHLRTSSFELRRVSWRASSSYGASFSALTSSTFLPVSDASNCAARSRAPPCAPPPGARVPSP